MRKILLIAAVLFSLGSMAQKPFGFIKNVKTLDKNLKVNNLMKMPSASINNMAKAPAKAPEGESHIIISTVTTLFMVSVLFQNSTKQSILYMVLTTRFILKT